jgi:hypothetical protein
MVCVNWSVTLWLRLGRNDLSIHRARPPTLQEAIERDLSLGGDHIRVLSVSHKSEDNESRQGLEGSTKSAHGEVDWPLEYSVG